MRRDLNIERESNIEAQIIEHITYMPSHPLYYVMNPLQEKDRLRAELSVLKRELATRSAITKGEVKP